MHPDLARNPRRFRLHRLALAILLITTGAGLGAGCSRRSAERPASPAAADTLANGLPRAMVPALSAWTAMWQAAIPGFTPESLAGGTWSPALRGGDVQPLKNFYPAAPEEQATFEVLSALSPNGRYRLVFDWYQEIVEEEGGIEIGGEPDSAPLLLDLRLGSSNVFEFCGTYCGYDWGCWMDSTRFALAGWSEATEGSESYSGFLGLYSLADSSQQSFITRPVSKDGYEKYRAAWEAWVKDRYRTWKSTRRRA